MVPATFQLYRFSDDDLVWWRLVSPNGRGVARAPHGVDSVDEARTAVLDVVGGLDGLSTVLRLTDAYRWHWVLQADGVPVAEGIGDQDRRVRCEYACRTFTVLAATARVDPALVTFRRVGAPSRPR
ncbi:MAG: hypothetical protein AAGC49_00690 [Brevundimonas sp.]